MRKLLVCVCLLTTTAAYGDPVSKSVAVDAASVVKAGHPIVGRGLDQASLNIDAA